MSNTPQNSSSPFQGLSLSAEAQAQVRLAAQTPGNQLPNVEEIARTDVRAKQGGGRTEAEHQVSSAQRRKASEEANLKEAKRQVLHTEPKVLAKEKGTKMGVVGWFVLILLVIGLVASIWVEQAGAGKALRDTGFAGVTSTWEGMVITMTAVTVGLAMVIGFKKLPPHIRRRMFIGACGLLVVLFMTWAVTFAIQAEKARTESVAGFNLNISSDDASNGERATETAGGWSAWVMFFSLVSMMTLTTFVGKTGVDHHIAQYQDWVTNDDYNRALDDVKVHNDEVNRAEAEIGALSKKLAAYIDEENKAVTQARTLYLALRKGGDGLGGEPSAGATPAPIAPTPTTAPGAAVTTTAIAMMAAFIFAGCDDGGNAIKGQKPKNMDEFMSDAGANEEMGRPVMRVLALSPVLPPEAKKIAAAEIEVEIGWIANHAPEGSETAVMDALECRPIASLKAVKGVARIRRKALQKPVLAIKEFLSRTNSRAKEDGRIHLPHVAQTLAQLRLPAGTHVVVMGSPVFRNEGADKFFDMSDGRVPSDGMLFEDPKLSLFSVIGRENALKGLYWHVGYSGDEAFVDDTHRQGVTRFTALYIGGMGGTLVTHQPSFLAAMKAARENRRDPLMTDKPDANSPAEMVKVVKDIKQATRELETNPTKNAGARGGMGAGVRKDGLQEREETRDVAQSEPKQSAVELDAHGNPKGAEHDLGGKDALKGQRIMVASFDHDDDIETSPLMDALRAKGATVERVRYPLPQIAAWRRMLEQTDQLWLWSSEESGHLPKEHLQAMVELWKAGKLALCLLADNTPFTKEAARVLSAVVPGSNIDGQYQGEKKLSARTNGKGPGFDAGSPMFSGLTTVFEGNTISKISGKGLTPLCWASDGNPLISTFQHGGSSRLVAHGGFTSFYKRFWDSAGTARLAANMAAWLAGVGGGTRQGIAEAK